MVIFFCVCVFDSFGRRLSTQLLRIWLQSRTAAANWNEIQLSCVDGKNCQKWFVECVCVCVLSIILEVLTCFVMALLTVKVVYIRNVTHTYANTRWEWGKTNALHVCSWHSQDQIMDSEGIHSSRVNFLLEAASLLPPKNRSLKLLQSFYLWVVFLYFPIRSDYLLYFRARLIFWLLDIIRHRTKSRKIDSTYFRQHSDSVFSNEEMCIKCSTPWSSSEFSVSIGTVRQTKKQSQKIQNGIDDKSKSKQYYMKKQIKSCNNNVVSIRDKLFSSNIRFHVYEASFNSSITFIVCRSWNVIYVEIRQKLSFGRKPRKSRNRTNRLRCYSQPQ